MSSSERTVPVRVPALRTLALNIPCARCQAGPGESCKKPSGERLELSGLPICVHIQRIVPVWVIYKTGYRHGSRAMKEEMTSADARGSEL